MAKILNYCDPMPTINQMVLFDTPFLTAGRTVFSKAATVHLTQLDISPPWSYDSAVADSR
jgi:hypothetical protein